MIAQRSGDAETPVILWSQWSHNKRGNGSHGVFLGLKGLGMSVTQCLGTHVSHFDATLAAAVSKGVAFLWVESRTSDDLQPSQCRCLRSSRLSGPVTSFSRVCPCRAVRICQPASGLCNSAGKGRYRLSAKQWKEGMPLSDLPCLWA